MLTIIEEHGGISPQTGIFNKDTGTRLFRSEINWFQIGAFFAYDQLSYGRLSDLDVASALATDIGQPRSDVLQKLPLISVFAGIGCVLLFFLSPIKFVLHQGIGVLVDIIRNDKVEENTYDG